LTDEPTDQEGGRARSVFRGTALLTLARLLDRGSTFVLALVIAPRLGAAGLGTFTAALAIYGVFTLAGQAGTTNFLVREITVDRTRTASYIVHLSVVATAISLILIGALEALIPHVGYAHALRDSAAIIVLAVLGTVLNSIQEAAFLAYQRMEFETIATLISSLIYVGISVALLLGGHGVPSLMWTYVACEYAVTAVYFVLISRYIAKLRFSFRLSLAWQLFKEMKAFTASSVLAALFARPEVIVLSLLASAKQVGYYGAAIRVAELPQLVPEVFMANVFTLLSSAFGVDEPRFRELQAKALRAMVAFALPLTALMFAAAPGIIGVLFGAKFHASVALLRVSAFNVLFVSLMAVFWRALAARHRQGAVLRVQIAMVAVRFGGAIGLIAPLAAVGAAISVAASSLIQMSMLAFATARSGAPAPLLRPAWRFALAAVATAAVTWIVDSTLDVWVALVAGGATYVVSAILLGAVSADDRALLRRLRRSSST
jgi:O-antigen/teichoic acid export membrane protein